MKEPFGGKSIKMIFQYSYLKIHFFCSCCQSQKNVTSDETPMKCFEGHDCKGIFWPRTDLPCDENLVLKVSQKVLKLVEENQDLLKKPKQ